MSDLNNIHGEEPLKIDFSKIVVPYENFKDQIVGGAEGPYTYNYSNDIVGGSSVNFGGIGTAYAKEEPKWNVNTDTDSWEKTQPQVYNDPNSNVTYINPTQINPEETKVKGTGNIFANTPTAETKPSVAELQRVVQKLDKLEKMINPNSKKSLILWEEDNSFKNLISSIVSYSTTCDTEEEFPIELFDRLKALSEDVEKQIVEGKEKIVELEAQAKANTQLGGILSGAYIAATAGLSREEYEAGLGVPELEEFKPHLATISTCSPDSTEYKSAEKAIKTKINNLENNVHVEIDLERTTSKGGALEYIKQEIAPALARLEEEYAKFNASANVTEIDGEEAVTALAVRKSLVRRVYDTFVRSITSLFKKKNKVK